MPNTAVMKQLTTARESLKKPYSFDDFLAKLSPKDRANAEKRVSVLEAEPDRTRAPLWRRLACSLMTLAPNAKFVGKQTVQFYIPDGKYRMQVFALEDLQDGKMTVYCPNVLEDAGKAHLLRPAPAVEPHMHVIESSGEALQIEPLDKTSINPGPHFKDMVGWNRKAQRITLPPTPSPSQIEAVELMCALAAQHFARTALPAVAPTPAKK